MPRKWRSRSRRPTANSPPATPATRPARGPGPRLDRARAEWLAPHWARPDAEGRWQILGDPAHKIVNANLYQLEETLALYRAITAPTLVVEASDNAMDQWWKGSFTLAEFHERLRHVPDLRRESLPDCGHMLHHDQPQALAGLVAAFTA